ncbi:MAG TPA: response regulator [Elusimicrobiota bacterium]|nr:response regulator [Elusimicrobiota bacterium]
MTDPVKILVVDDEEGMRDMLSYELASKGYRITTAADGEEAIGKARNEKFHLVLSDLKMPKVDGIQTLRAVKALDPDVEVIISTGYGTIETAVEAMKYGAYDFVQKPFNMDEVFLLIEKALEKKELRALAAIYKTSRSVFNTIRADVLFPRAVEAAREIFSADGVCLMLMDEAGALTTAAALGCDEAVLGLVRRTVQEKLSGGKPVPPDPLAVALSPDPASAAGPGIFCPLVVDGNLLGVLYAGQRKGEKPFLSDELQRCGIFCSQLAHAVYNVRLYRALEQNIGRLEEANLRLKETQAKLFQTEKLAAVGQLAAGVAHELNNPLTGIMGFAQLLLDDKTLTPSQREDLECIHKQSQRCRQIIQNLLQFSRREEPRKEKLAVVALLEATLDLVKYDFSSSGIRIVKEFPEESPVLLGDKSQLQQVFLNLLTNARQAVGDRKDGRIEIVVGRSPSGVSVVFRDNGVGISEENMSRMFDPFFTTKPVGQGTGLGLSISYGIVQQHGGALSVRSELGVGSEFLVEFPV